MRATLLLLWQLVTWQAVVHDASSMESSVRTGGGRTAHHLGQLPELVHLGADTRGGLKASELKHVVVKQHSDVVLECDLARESGRLVWLHNGKQVLSTGQTRHFWRKQAHPGRRYNDISIRRVNSSDNGIWQCQQQSSDGSTRTSKPVWLIVAGLPSLPYITHNGKELRGSHSFTIREKHTLSLQCHVNGSSPVPSRVQWFVGDANVTNASVTRSEYLDDLRAYSMKSCVSFEATRAHHRKQVVCSVAHLALEGDADANATVSLNVEYEPEFVMSRVPDFGYPLREGMSVLLKCSVNANPASTPVWFKDDVGVKATQPAAAGVLNFSSISVNDSGWYRCFTSHRFGDFTSFGYFLNVKPLDDESNVPAQSLRVTGDDETALLSCGSGNAPSSCWLKENQHGTWELVHSGEYLHLDKVLRTGSGRYKCLPLTDGSGKDARTDPEGMPTIASGSRRFSVIAGSTVTFSVKFCANPPATRVLWITRTAFFNPGDARGRVTAHNLSAPSSNSCQNASMTLHEVCEEDSGDYMFVVKNPIGIQETTILLNVTIVGYSLFQRSSSSSLTAKVQRASFALFTFLVFGLPSLTVRN